MSTRLLSSIRFVLGLTIVLMTGYTNSVYSQAHRTRQFLESPTILSVLDSTSDCNKLLDRCNNLLTCPTDECIRRAYDTIGVFIEHCNRIISTSVLTSYLDNRNTCIHFFPDSAVPYIEWMKQMLYVNPDTGYYCAIAMQMAFTIWDFGLDGRNEQNPRAAGAIFDYLLSTHHCPQLEYKILSYRNDIHTGPPDTTNPSVDSIGFSVLRGPQYIPNTVTASTSIQSLELESVGNPFTEHLVLRYNTTTITALKVEVCDLLGHVVFARGLGAQLEGPHSLELDTRNWISGSYYARISTIDGAVRTVKVFKQ